MQRETGKPPYLTGEIAGIGGTIKEHAEDFRVAEVPLYLPCGDGEHVYAEIEKRNLTTLEAIRRIAKALGVQERDMGYAGMKDSRGITRQTLSVPRVKPEALLALEIPGLTVLSAIRHRNKLKLGHLAGNRFSLKVRGVDPDAAERAEAVCAVLARRGVPNFFGPQRYGTQQNSHRIGRAILLGNAQGAVDALIGSPDSVDNERWKAAIAAYRQGDLAESLSLFPPSCRMERDILQRLVARPGAWDKALHALNPRLRSLFLSAWQSAIFDAVLRERLEDCDRVMAGDLAWKHANGACFLVEDPRAEAGRAEAFEISPSGPLFGGSMTPAAGEPRAIEERMLACEGLPPEGPPQGWPDRLSGGRRPLRVPLADPRIDREGDCLALDFTLPKGAYATALLREVMKDW